MVLCGGMYPPHGAALHDYYRKKTSARSYLFIIGVIANIALLVLVGIALI